MGVGNRNICPWKLRGVGDYGIAVGESSSGAIVRLILSSLVDACLQKCCRIEDWDCLAVQDASAHPSESVFFLSGQLP